MAKSWGHKRYSENASSETKISVSNIHTFTYPITTITTILNCSIYNLHCLMTTWWIKYLPPPRGFQRFFLNVSSSGPAVNHNMQHVTQNFLWYMSLFAFLLFLFQSMFLLLFVLSALWPSLFFSYIPVFVFLRILFLKDGAGNTGVTCLKGSSNPTCQCFKILKNGWCDVKWHICVLKS